MHPVSNQNKEIGRQFPDHRYEYDLDIKELDFEEKVEKFTTPILKEKSSDQTASLKRKGIKANQKKVKKANTIHHLASPVFSPTPSSFSFKSDDQIPADLQRFKTENLFQEQNISSTASTSTTLSSVSNISIATAYTLLEEPPSIQSAGSNISIPTGYTQWEEPTSTQLNQAHIKALEEDISKRVKEILKNGEVDLDKSHFVINRQTVQARAIQLQNLMPKIAYAQLLLMSAFIEQNRKKLKTLAQRYAPDGIYIRREMTDLPLSLLVTPEGQFIWETKKKARDEALMGDSFKKLYKCVDHDKLQLYVSGTMSLPYYERGMTLPADDRVKMNAATREMTAGKAMQGLPHVVQTVHLMTYRAKPAKSKIPQGLQIKIKIIMQYYPNGDLKHLMMRRISFSEQQKEHMTRSLIDGILAIHDKGWIHGDIKPGNIFFDQNLSPYIGDFGCTHPKSQLLDAAIVAHCHPDFYIAPRKERLNLQEQQDMFTLGLTLAQMELNLSQLSWDNQALRTLIDRAKTQENVNSRSDVAKFIRLGLQHLYQQLPEQTKRQKLIKKLIHPEFSQIPTAAEAKAIWASLSTSHLNFLFDNL